MRSSYQNVDNDVSALIALNRVRPELLTLQRTELLPITVDVGTALVTAQRAQPKLVALRHRISKELPHFDLAQFDKLDDYRLALGLAHANYVAATQLTDGANTIFARAASARKALVLETDRLSQHGLLDAAVLAQVQATHDPNNVAADLILLTDALRRVLPTLTIESVVGQRELEQAACLAERIFYILHEAAQGSAAGAEALDLRARAYTKFLLAYDDARRAVALLRPQDADDIAPPLHPPLVCDGAARSAEARRRQHR